MVKKDNPLKRYPKAVKDQVLAELAKLHLAFHAYIDMPRHSQLALPLDVQTSLLVTSSRLTISADYRR